MIACVDVDYREEGAVAACVLFRAWEDEHPAGELVEHIAEVEPYQPGQFYRRELPCLLAVLGPVAEGLEAVVIDGYVWLGDEGTPGLGGHLLGDKTTASVAKMRESVPWVSLFSPFPFHSVYSVEDHKKHIDWVKVINPDALVSVKVSTPTDVDMVAVGSYYAGAHIIQVDGGYGGTGAAPEIAKKNIAMPIELAIPKVHRFLVQEGIRDEVVLMASGGIRTADDIAKIIALGADGCILGTSELVALGCTRCSNCERGRGCPFGLTTTDPQLSQLVDPDWGAERIGRLYASYQMQLRDIVRRLGLRSVRELRGRIDLLNYHRKEGGHHGAGSNH